MKTTALVRTGKRPIRRLLRSLLCCFAPCLQLPKEPTVKFATCCCVLFKIRASTIFGKCSSEALHTGNWAYKDTGQQGYISCQFRSLPIQYLALWRPVTSLTEGKNFAYSPFRLTPDNLSASYIFCSWAPSLLLLYTKQPSETATSPSLLQVLSPSTSHFRPPETYSWHRIFFHLPSYNFVILPICCNLRHTRKTWHD